MRRLGLPVDVRGEDDGLGIFFCFCSFFVGPKGSDRPRHESLPYQTDQPKTRRLGLPTDVRERASGAQVCDACYYGGVTEGHSNEDLPHTPKLVRHFPIFSQPYLVPIAMAP